MSEYHHIKPITGRNGGFFMSQIATQQK
jgi:hypothetical protein